MRNILLRGYSGRLLPVNPGARKVQGVCAYPSVHDLPVVPELAFIAIPARPVRQTLSEMAAKGTRAVFILSAEFGAAPALPMDFVYEMAMQRGLQFNSLPNVGNSAQTGVIDLLRLYEETQDQGSSSIKLL